MQLQAQSTRRRQRYLWKYLLGYVLAILLVLAGGYFFIVSLDGWSDFVAAGEISLMGGLSIGLLTFLFSPQRHRIVRTERKLANKSSLTPRSVLSTDLTILNKNPTSLSDEQLRQFKGDPHQSYVTLASALQVLAFSVLLYYFPRIASWKILPSSKILALFFFAYFFPCSKVSVGFVPFLAISTVVTPLALRSKISHEASGFGWWMVAASGKSSPETSFSLVVASGRDGALMCLSLCSWSQKRSVSRKLGPPLFPLAPVMENACCEEGTQ